MTFPKPFTKMDFPKPFTKHVVCFDLDDTLIHTRAKYNRAYHDCALYLIDVLGSYMPLGSDLIKQVELIDRPLIKTLQYSPERMPTAWALLYRSICEENDLLPDLGVISVLRGKAAAFQRPPFDLLVGVREALNGLNKSIFTPILLTIGDVPLQRHKVRSSPILSNLFSEDHDTFVICPWTKKEVLEALVSHIHPQGKVIMVGDSLRMDMQAAKEAGAVAVHIPTPGQWDHDDAEVKPDYTLKSIKELLATLGTIITGY